MLDTPGGSKRTLIVAAAIATAILLVCVGCVSGRTYRTQLSTSPYCVHGKNNDCSSDALHVVAGPAKTSAPVLLGYVEFDDQGYLRRPELKDALVAHVRKLAHERPLLITVFAHGWKHNADASDGNVKAFELFLTKLAAADAQVCAGTSCEGRQVIGVYVGWRGLSNRIEPFKTLTFWGRKNRAHRVGGDGATEILTELAKIKAIKREGERPAQSRLIITGHSFGGALVYNAINQTLMHDTEFLNKGRVARNAADLIVLVNPAFEASRFHAIKRKADGLSFLPRQKPILTVFTSEADTATKWAFPAGRRLGTIFSEHRDAEQKEENVRALGHYMPFRTHALTLGEHTDQASKVELQQVACAWKNYSSGAADTWQVGSITLTRLAPQNSGSRRFNPYMIVSVEKGLISSHNDIWGEEFSNFLYRFVAVQTYGLCQSLDPETLDEISDQDTDMQ